MKNRKGFTIVELLVVIVVTSIIAATTVAGFSGLQKRARDSQREQDIMLIAKALEMYYVDNGQYPLITGSYEWTSGYAMDSYTANTFVPNSWNELKSHLAPYVSSIGIDPSKQLGPSSLGHAGRFGYEYSSNPGGERCNVPRRTGQTYSLFVKYESRPQTHKMIGTCTYLAPSGTVLSSYTVVK